MEQRRSIARSVTVHFHPAARLDAGSQAAAGNATAAVSDHGRALRTGWVICSHVQP